MHLFYSCILKYLRVNLPRTLRQCVCRQWTLVWSSTGGRWCSSGSEAKSTAALWWGICSSRTFLCHIALLQTQRERELTDIHYLRWRWTHFNVWERCTHGVRGIWPASPGRLHGSSRILMYPGPQTGGNLWWVELWTNEENVIQMRHWKTSADLLLHFTHVLLGNCCNTQNRSST